MGSGLTKVFPSSEQRQQPQYHEHQIHWKTPLEFDQAKKQYIADKSLNAGCSNEAVILRIILDDSIGITYLMAYAKQVTCPGSSKSNFGEVLSCWMAARKLETTKSYRREGVMQLFEQYSPLLISFNSPHFQDGMSVLSRNSDRQLDITDEMILSLKCCCFSLLLDYIQPGFASSPDYEELCEELHRCRNRVSENDFVYGSVVAEGGFGVILHCRKRSTGREYAVKIQPKAKLLSHFRRDYSKVVLEMQAYARCMHPYVCELEYAFHSDRLAALVFPLAGAGDLRRSLKLCPKAMSVERVRFYLAEIISALLYLHSFSLLYRDLKPANVLLNRDGHICLADFGSIADIDRSLAILSDWDGDGNSSVSQSRSKSRTAATAATAKSRSHNSNASSSGLFARAPLRSQHQQLQVRSSTVGTAINSVNNSVGSPVSASSESADGLFSNLGSAVTNTTSAADASGMEREGSRGQVEGGGENDERFAVGELDSTRSNRSRSNPSRRIPANAVGAGNVTGAGAGATTARTCSDMDSGGAASASAATIMRSQSQSQAHMSTSAVAETEQSLGGANNGEGNVARGSTGLSSGSPPIAETCPPPAVNIDVNADSQGEAPVQSDGDAEADAEAQSRVDRRAGSLVGTVEYMAPELLVMFGNQTLHAAGYTDAVDWWALGVTAYKLLTGHEPFRRVSHKRLSMVLAPKMASRSQYAMVFDSVFGEVSYNLAPFHDHPEAVSLIKELLQFNPAHRLGSGSSTPEGTDTHRTAVMRVQQHPFFHGVDWKAVDSKGPTWVPPYIPVTELIKVDSLSVTPGCTGMRCGGATGCVGFGLECSTPGLSAAMIASGREKWVLPSADTGNKFAVSREGEAHFREWGYCSTAAIEAEERAAATVSRMTLGIVGVAGCCFFPVVAAAERKRKTRTKLANEEEEEEEEEEEW